MKIGLVAFAVCTGCAVIGLGVWLMRSAVRVGYVSDKLGKRYSRMDRPFVFWLGVSAFALIIMVGAVLIAMGFWAATTTEIDWTH